MKNVCGYPEKPYIVDALGGGACWLDFNRDGRLDLFLVQGSPWAAEVSSPPPRDALFRARADGTFEDVTEAAGIRESAWGGGCAVGDIDSDGWPDLFVTNHGPNVLWRNRGDGSFEDATAAAGLQDGRWSASALLADFDGDAALDLVVTHYLRFDWKNPPRNGGKNFCTWHGVEVFCGPRGLNLESPIYYRNRGDGTFSDQTAASGIAAAPLTYGLGLVALDYDLDGNLDFYMANDAHPNYLWRNKGNGQFEEVALRLGAALSDGGKEQAGMGVDAADYDGDGWPDLFVTNFSEDTYALYHNESNGFTDVSIPSGVTLATYVPLGWGVKFFDVENDGDLDIVVANGHVYPQVEKVATSPPITYLQPANLLENNAGRFVDIAARSGPGFARAYGARGLAIADYDNDGDVDVLLSNIDAEPALLTNSGSPNAHWLGVTLEGRDSNRDGFGATLKLSGTGVVAQTRWAHPGGSFCSSSDPRVHFGMGGAPAADLEIRWPSGKIDRHPAVPADSFVVAVEGSSSLHHLPR